jgi:hypothetical protein
VCPRAGVRARKPEHGACEQQRRYYQDDTEGDGEPILRLRRVDLEIDWIAGTTVERRIRIGAEQEVPVQLRRVFHVQREEPVHSRGRAARHERNQPVHQCGEERSNAP